MKIKAYSVLGSEKMKKLTILLLMAFILEAGDLPFSRGVNLTNWFQFSNAEQIPFGRYSKADFENIRSLGADVIRLPINLHAMTISDAPDYQLHPVFLFFLDQAVDWAEELGLYLILDNHTFDPSVDTPTNIGLTLIPVWQQMAEHYKGRSELIIYEVLNEPHGINDAIWNAIQQQVVTAIREIDSLHTIIIGPAGWNSYNNLAVMPVYADSNLIYSYHFYDPFIFTHQGASWTTPSLEPLFGVPFPYDAEAMPPVPDELAGTWVESEINNYPNYGNIDWVTEKLDIAYNFSQERNVPVFCGEWGVYIPNSDPADRVEWYWQLRLWFEDHQIAWTSWDYHGGFGLFEAGGNGLFQHDLNIPLLEAMGFTAPPQSDFILLPDSVSLDLYRDFTAHGIVQSNWVSQGSLNYYDDSNPVAGHYAITWSGAAQYGNITFDFKPDKDLSLLMESAFVLDMWAKAENTVPDLDLRFLDSKTDVPEDHPWRMGITLDAEMLPRDNQWHHLQIPLEDMLEKGAWDNNQWFDPQGDFDWAAVDLFQIVAEYGAFPDGSISFDEIRIVDPNCTGLVQKEIQPHSPILSPNFPNPFNAETTISFSLLQPALVNLTVFDLSGRIVARLLNHKAYSSGKHFVNFDARDLPSAIYFIQLQAGASTSVHKALCLK
ncbi:MAG TPA: T9SS type A sorting domain-containing protein [Candidatus Marinimicrobia bacterium]|nr:T9SS type A sorting domain-containing protein [Candidatus Neomarinimicrobiota bacterium]